MNPPRTIIGPVVRQMRERACLTQPMLVARIHPKGWDISRETLAKVEAQIRWIADFEVVHLAYALGIKPGDLFDAAKGIQKSAKTDGRRPSTAE
ncbi:MAG: helix-turn-helix domain-containing protein [Limisphaerales bacterium]